MTPTPNDSRRGTARRLERALAILLQHASDGTLPQALTIAALCRLARVSRNSVYRYHPDILATLHQHRVKRRVVARPQEPVASPHHGDSGELHKQIAGLAALVDHYYAAYREVRALLERRDRELADLRRAVHVKVTSVRR